MSLFASTLAAAAATSTIYSDYPGFLDRKAVVEATFDRGPIVEMIVKCPGGTGILSYSKLERRYCSSKHACFEALNAAVRDTCR